MLCACETNFFQIDELNEQTSPSLVDLPVKRVNYFLPFSVFSRGEKRCADPDAHTHVNDWMWNSAGHKSFVLAEPCRPLFKCELRLSSANIFRQGLCGIEKREREQTVPLSLISICTWVPQSRLVWANEQERKSVLSRHLIDPRSHSPCKIDQWLSLPFFAFRLVS